MLLIQFFHTMVGPLSIYKPVRHQITFWVSQTSEVVVDKQSKQTTTSPEAYHKSLFSSPISHRQHSQNTTYKINNWHPWLCLEIDGMSLRYSRWTYCQGMTLPSQENPMIFLADVIMTISKSITNERFLLRMYSGCLMLSFV